MTIWLPIAMRLKSVKCIPKNNFLVRNCMWQLHTSIFVRAQHCQRRTLVVDDYQFLLLCIGRTTNGFKRTAVHVTFLGHIRYSAREI